MGTVAFKIVASLAFAGGIMNAAPGQGFAAIASAAQAGDMAAGPDFTGSGQKYLKFRTAIREEYAKGVNFNHSYRVIVIGCGESCVFAWLADMQTGKLSDVPISGYDYYRLHLVFSSGSPAVTATWQQQEPSVRCVSRHYTLADGSFRITRPDDVRFGECPAF